MFDGGQTSNLEGRWTWAKTRVEIRLSTKSVISSGLECWSCASDVVRADLNRFESDWSRFKVGGGPFDRRWRQVCYKWWRRLFRLFRRFRDQTFCSFAARSNFQRDRERKLTRGMRFFLLCAALSQCQRPPPNGPPNGPSNSPRSGGPNGNKSKNLGGTIESQAQKVWILRTDKLNENYSRAMYIL